MFLHNLPLIILKENNWQGEQIKLYYQGSVAWWRMKWNVQADNFTASNRAQQSPSYIAVIQ